MPKQKLTKKQKSFIQEYLKDKNGTQAAIRAGYSKHCANVIANETLSKPYMQEALQKELDKQSKRTLIDADYVLGNIKKVVERCLQEEEVFDRNGNHTGEFIFDSSGANRALELLGKHLNLFVDKTSLSLSNPDGSPVQVSINVKSKDDK